MEEGTSKLLDSAAFDAYNAQLQGLALTATRKAVGLPADVAFHRSMDHSFAQELDAFSARVLSVTNKLLSLVGSVDTTQGGRGKGKAKLTNQDDVIDNFHSLVVDSMDQLLERTDICLDDFLGRNKAPSIAINPPITSNSTSKKNNQPKSTPKGHLEPVIQHAAHLVKPQLSFSKKPDNSDTPWYPTLPHKYNAKVPLGHIYHDGGAEPSTGIIGNHPYRYEITHLAYPSRMFAPCTPTSPPALEETQATWVSTVDAFQRMLAKLKNATEIAVDLEHHSYRSYSGFLCLMQISDREEDWVVDLLTVRDEVESLNEVFTDPAIVKVFHGAESDIVWLQQDFNLYIVNLFDTYHASKLLDFPRHGLANLLEMYCDFIPDKRYQLADWRIRPLPEDMLQYARSDTHFLLFIYDNLRNALLDRSQSQSRSPSSSPPPFASSSSSPNAARGMLNQAIARSAETSLRVYTKEPYDVLEGGGPGGWDTLAKKWNKIALTAGGPGVGIAAMQREVYRSVHGWRERVAREEDESTRYVLQNHFLFQLAEQPPADMAALLSIFRSSVPPVVRRRAKELLDIVREAVKRGMALSQMPGQVVVVEEDTRAKIKPVNARKDVVMLDAELKTLEKVDGNGAAATLWGTGPSRPTTSTSHSSLFGSSQSVQLTPASSTPFASSVSTLFGNIGGKKTNGSPQIVSAPDVNELVRRINRSFVMAPPVPQIASTTPHAPVQSGQEIDEFSGMQVEIPYVPASQRPTKRLKEETDTIVVVGQARQKRKRAGKAAETSAGVEDESGPVKGKQKQKAQDESGVTVEGQESFDFSAVPNILDDNPDVEDRKRKRQKKQNKGGMFYGDFPAPPKAYSELKSGNQSHTFK
ncbi:hypothetical protein B0H34DRAFT_737252 [Crassisporium funariophilum]|nr:hypothetical protein B0H34DRAFT_737252 [Crassisporium funariophilum]